MPRHDSAWPDISQYSSDFDQNTALIQEEAQTLLKCGAPSKQHSAGRPCPYPVFSEFCSKVIAYTAFIREFKPPPSPLASAMEQGHSSSSETLADNHKIAKNSPMNASLNIITYDVLVHCVPFSFDVKDKSKAISEIVAFNKGFIPNVEIRSIERILPRNHQVESYSGLIVQFTRAADANAAIKEGLLFVRKVLQCDKSSESRRQGQCFRCQQLGHSSDDCFAPPLCGFCAECHTTLDCVHRNDPKKMRCAFCYSKKHKAWSKSCAVRDIELHRVRPSNFDNPFYYFTINEPADIVKTLVDPVPSRQYAGSRRYSLDYLSEVISRGALKPCLGLPLTHGKELRFEIESRQAAINSKSSKISKNGDGSQEPPAPVTGSSSQDDKIPPPKLLSRKDYEATTKSMNETLARHDKTIRQAKLDVDARQAKSSLEKLVLQHEKVLAKLVHDARRSVSLAQAPPPEDPGPAMRKILAETEPGATDGDRVLQHFGGLTLDELLTPTEKSKGKVIMPKRGNVVQQPRRKSLQGSIETADK